MTRQINAIVSVGLLALLAALLPACLSGQTFTFTPGTASGNITATNSSCTSTACVQISVSAETSAVAWQISGTFSATITFEATVDGSHWVSWAVIADGSSTTQRSYATTQTAAGIYQMNVAGFYAVRARCSAYTSGTAAVFARRGTGPAMP